MAVKIKDTNRIPELMEKLSGIKGRTIEVGVLEDGKQAMIAHVHEYGINIKVSPAMRGYLSSQGLHLKSSTTHIRIPERSFIRSWWDNEEGEIIKKAESLTDDVLDLGIDGEMFLRIFGEELQDGLKDHIEELSSPPNHPFTIEQKGSSSPLIGKTTSLRDSIKYEVK